MIVIHISAECFPVAKVGGLADVVGSLPKYLAEEGVESWVVIPRYDLPWLRHHHFTEVHRGVGHLGTEQFDFVISKEKDDVLGFPLYVVDIPSRFGRPGIYIDPFSNQGYWDEVERNFSFQIAVLDWIHTFSWTPDVLHCHDHQSALIPFLASRSTRYPRLHGVPSVLTIHNGEYQGNYDFGKRFLLPPFEAHASGVLEWHHRFNALASAIKSAWAVTTVSPNYLNELMHEAAGLEPLLRMERAKCRGILNGIDVQVWNPATDPMIPHHFNAEDAETGKRRNKEELCKRFGVDPDRPTIVFIGRFAKEKGADLVPEVISAARHYDVQANFLVLGTGDAWITQRMNQVRFQYPGYVNAQFEYNESLAHLMYAGADFLLMPSRVEPCGLNQLYALRYGAVPIVRSTGGLYDTVRDISEPDGYGIRFNQFSLEDAVHAIGRATAFYYEIDRFKSNRKKIMQLDFSWSKSAGDYAILYHTLKGNRS
jgi:starch synthase